MKPPICEICNKHFSNGGYLIRFKETEADKKSNKLLKQKGFVGHPANAIWFCEEHATFALKYSYLKKQDAIKLIKAEIENQ